MLAEHIMLILLDSSNNPVIIPILQMRELRFGEIKSLKVTQLKDARSGYLALSLNTLDFV